MACMREFCGVWRLLVACCIFTCGSLVITAPGADALAFLQDAPKFLQGFIGLNLKINCSTDDPNATVSLWHGPNPFSPMTERLPSPNKIVKSGQVFTILNLIVSDAGNHKCKAQNKNQSIEWPPGSGMTFLTRAKLPDHFVLKPDTPIIIMTGQEGKVTCEADGIKIAKLQWNKVDGQVDTPVPDSMVTVVKDASTNIISATLRITNAQKQDDGIYKCVVTVFHKSEDRSARVEVKDPEPPKIEPYKKATTITEGTEKILKCIATAYPKPSVTWFKGGKQLNVTNCPSSQNNKKCEGIAYEVSEEGLNSLLHTTGVLKIRSALYPRDQGQFKCVASNEYYSDTLLIDLNVQVAPRLVKKRDPVLVPVETETQVVCTLKTSNPLPTFQWKYQTLDCPDLLTDCQPDDTKWQNVPASVPGSQTPTNESVVTVTKDLQSTFYQCNATNILGDDTHIVKLIRREKIRKLIELDPTRKTQFNEGSTLFLPCIDRCFFCDTHFTRDGLKLLPENDARVNVTKVHADDLRFTLTIKNLTLNDSGNYRCVGVDDPPQFPLFDAVNITIDALVKPNITKLIPYNGEEGSPGKPARLFCEVTANPPAKISWYFTNSRGERREITESNDLGGNIDACKSRASGYFYLRKNNRSHLVICSPKFEQHSGTYECRAENIVDSMSKTVFLDVFAAPTITAPVDGYDITLDIGEDLNETCIAKGNPSPEVMWRRNSTDGLEILGKDVGSVLLNIESVGEDDFRTYTCVASNKYGDVSVSMPVLKVDNEPQARTDPPLLSTSAMVGIAVGVGVFVLILLVIGCLLYRRQKKQMDEYKELYFLRTTDYKIDPDRSLLEQCNDLPYDPEWEFPEERLVLGDLLGSGAFGQVIKAEAVGIVGFNPREKAPEDFKRRSKIRRSTRAKDLAKEHTAGGQRSLKTAVAVKTLKEGASEAEYKDLASELKILIHLGQHKNIINLLGACTRGKRLMVIMEFAPHGSLLSFLRGKREVYEATWTKTMNNPEQEFTLVDLVMASYQISRGMAFLASKKCVHRDMAARNILVGNDYVMKIADFGLARDIYKDDLYVKKTSGLLPVKWMAPESLFDRVYNEKTDVWSFGILLWEAFTLGGTPYPGLPTEKLLDYLSEGKRMELPAKCPLEVYTVMRDCWAHDPDERPAFSTLNERLGKVLERNMTKDNPYIALQMEEEEEELGQGYYLQPCESGLRESKRYVESPVHTPDREDHPGFEQEASAAGGENDDTRYGSPLPPLPPGLPIISDEDIQNAPLPPIPPSYDEALSDGSPPTSNGGGRESGIDMDDPGDGGEYIDDVKVKSPTPSRDGSKPVAIQMEDVGNGELPDTKVKTKGGRDANETEV